MLIEKGYCQCGCGMKTNIAKHDHKQRNYKKGEPVKFIKGHHSRITNAGYKAWNWNGGRTLRTRGYVFIRIPDHPRALRGYVREQIVVAEKAIGKPLPKSAVIHHINGITSDNSPDNLVVCENQKYHLLLHRRARAVAAGFPASWRKCKVCQKYDDLGNLATTKDQHHYHVSCIRKYNNDRRKAKEEVA